MGHFPATLDAEVVQSYTVETSSSVLDREIDSHTVPAIARINDKVDATESIVMSAKIIARYNTDNREHISDFTIRDSCFAPITGEDVEEKVLHALGDHRYGFRTPKGIAISSELAEQVVQDFLDSSPSVKAYNFPNHSGGLLYALRDVDWRTKLDRFRSILSVYINGYTP